MDPSVNDIATTTAVVKLENGKEKTIATTLPISSTATKIKRLIITEEPATRGSDVEGMRFVVTEESVSGTTVNSNSFIITEEPATRGSDVEGMRFVVTKESVSGTTVNSNSFIITEESAVRGSTSEDLRTVITEGPAVHGSTIGDLKTAITEEPAVRSSAIPDLRTTITQSEQSVQKAFLARVFGTLTCQLLLTLGFTTMLVSFTPSSIKHWAKQHTYWSMAISMFPLMLVCLLAMTCYEKMRRKAPGNYIFLGAFTVALSVVLGDICFLHWDSSTLILMTVGIIAGTCLALAISALLCNCCSTPGCECAICAVTYLVAYVISFIYVEGYRRWNESPLLISCGAFMFCLYMVTDIQLMLHGMRKYSIYPEDYMYAALTMYLDIINLIIFIYRELYQIATCKIC